MTARTAVRWLHVLGYDHESLRKGLYKDGHNRADVQDYLLRVFLPLIGDLRRLSRHYDDNGNEMPFELPVGKKEHVFVVHDESCFWANDGLKYVDCMWGDLLVVFQCDVAGTPGWNEATTS